MCETGWDRWSEERDESEGVKGKAEPQASFLSLSFRVFVFTGAGMVAVPPSQSQWAKKRRKVGAWLLMVSVVPQRSTPKAKGNQTMHCPREVVPTVVLSGHPDVKEHERPGGETVALKKQRIHGGPEAHAEELPSGQVLRNQAEGLAILVVECMEGAVEPADAVMQHVPQVVLEVEHHRAAHDSQQEGGERGRLAGQWHRRPPEPLGYGGGEDVEQMVVRGECQSGANVGPGDGAVLVDLVASDGWPGGSQQVQHGVEEHQNQVQGH